MKYPMHEDSGVYVDVDRISAAFERRLRQLRWEHDAAVAGQMTLPLEVTER